MFTYIIILELPVRHLQFEQEFVGGRAIESGHLISKPRMVRLNVDSILHCLRCFHEVDKGIRIKGHHLEINIDSILNSVQGVLFSNNHTFFSL